MSEANLAKRLDLSFGNTISPKPFHNVFGFYLLHNQEELLKLENIDWEKTSPQELEHFYEAPPFLTSAAYLYLLPKVYRFCMKWREKASGLIIISTFFDLPLVNPAIIPAERMSTIENKLVWDFLISGASILGYEFRFDDDQDCDALKKHLGV